MKSLIIFILIGLLPTNALAYEVKYLKEKDPAPFTGYLITPEMEKDFRFIDKELEYQKKLNLALTDVNKSYEDNEVIMQKRIDNSRKQIDYLNDKLGDGDSFFSKVGYFLLGAATATAIAYGVVRATR